MSHSHYEPQGVHSQSGGEIFCRSKPFFREENKGYLHYRWISAIGSPFSLSAIRRMCFLLKTENYRTEWIGLFVLPAPNFRLLFVRQTLPRFGCHHQIVANLFCFRQVKWALAFELIPINVHEWNYSQEAGKYILTFTVSIQSRIRKNVRSTEQS